MEYSSDIQTVFVSLSIKSMAFGHSVLFQLSRILPFSQHETTWIKLDQIICKREKKLVIDMPEKSKF